MVSSGQEINYFGFVSLLRSFDWEIWLCLGHPNSASKLKCFRNACSFFSLFTKAVGIHLSIFFNDGSFNLPEIFFPYFFGPSDTSMSVFMAFICISVYCGTQRVFILFLRWFNAIEKIIDKNRWSSGQKNSKMSKISMNNCVGSFRIWLLYFHLFSVRAFFYDAQRYLKSFIIKTSFLKMYVYISGNEFRCQYCIKLWATWQTH